MNYDELKEVIKGYLLGVYTKESVACAFALWQLKLNGEVSR
jgi:hypothetical protein